MIGRRGFLGAMIGLFAAPAAAKVATHRTPFVFDPTWAERNVVPPMLGPVGIMPGMITYTSGPIRMIGLEKAFRKYREL